MGKKAKKSKKGNGEDKTNKKVKTPATEEKKAKAKSGKKNGKKKAATNQSKDTASQGTEAQTAL
ncbi:MAG: hypothetical protein HQL52_19840 [Magnetococcales bacterium]|nr:hypothetical protein [Magnetococcales bacterium]